MFLGIYEPAKEGVTFFKAQSLEFVESIFAVSCLASSARQEIQKSKCHHSLLGINDDK